jgi:hypothetical protein
VDEFNTILASYQIGYSGCAKRHVPMIILRVNFHCSCHRTRIVIVVRTSNQKLHDNKTVSIYFYFLLMMHIPVCIFRY